MSISSDTPGSERSSSEPGRPGPGAPAGVDDPQARLAHELAGLLDGSLRNIGLVMSSLRDPRNMPTVGGDDDLVRRLDTANQAMQHMATLIQRWMGRPPESPEPPETPVASPEKHMGTAGLHQQTRSLRETIQAAAKLLAPVAAARRVKLHVEIAMEVAGLTAGPIYPVIANGLRNAIESIGQRGPRQGGGVQLTARLDGDQIEIRILDDGPGVDPSIFDANGDPIHGKTTKHAGQGLGLALARDIVRELNGTLKLLNREAGGAELVVIYPAANLKI